MPWSRSRYLPYQEAVVFIAAVAIDRNYETKMLSKGTMEITWQMVLETTFVLMKILSSSFNLKYVSA